LNPRSRRDFDEQLEWVLKGLPPMIHELIEKVPLHVEDYPSDEVMDRLGIEYLDDLCGLYTGIPIGDKSVTHSGTLPDVVTIYREGILSAAADRGQGEKGDSPHLPERPEGCCAQMGTVPFFPRRGHVSTDRLRREIRITILHELAHHHGLTEEDLRKLGYG
jgi:predicted Zn-dependent protease with MMP-like domain